MKKEYFVLAVLSLVVFSVAFIAGCSTSPGGTGTPTPPFAANWWVDGVSGSDTNSGSGYSAPLKTIMKAMSKVGSNETIGVLGATYNEYVMWPAKNNVTLRGSGYVYIDGEDQHRCVSIESIPGVKNLTMKDIRIRNGSTEGTSTGVGSGIYADQSGLTVNLNSVIITDSFSIHTGYGGTLYSNNCTVEANKCSFWGNESLGPGGAITSLGGILNLTSCEVMGNESKQGGGIYLYGSTGRIVNCTIFRNKAEPDQGGGIYANATSLPTLEIINCTIVSNEASDSYGGGVWGNNVRIVNTIIWGNTCDAGSYPTYHDIYTDVISTVSYSDIGVQNASYVNGPGNVSTDPKLNTWPPSGLSTYYVSLKYNESPKSVAYGGTAEAGVPSVDFNGNARTTTTEVGYGSGYSMGATEQDNPAP